MFLSGIEQTQFINENSIVEHSRILPKTFRSSIENQLRSEIEFQFIDRVLFGSIDLIVDSVWLASP